MTALFITVLIMFCILAYEFIQAKEEISELLIERDNFLMQLEDLSQELFDATGRRTGYLVRSRSKEGSYR